MKITKTLTVLAIALTLAFVSCKPKDGDIQKAADTAVKAVTENVSVAVAGGVATLTGEVKDEAAKLAAEAAAKATKNVGSVVNNLTVTPQTPVVAIASNDALTTGLKDALKDFPGVTSSVASGKVVLVGEIAKAKWIVLKQAIDKLTPAGYDLAGLKIK